MELLKVDLVSHYYYLSILSIFVCPRYRLLADSQTATRSTILKILFIAKDKFAEDEIRNRLMELSEQDSIEIVYSYPEGEEFITNRIVKNQVPLDLVITESNILRRNVSEFKDRLVQDQARTYSNRDFKFSSIPIIVLVDPYENRNAFSDFAYAIDDLGTDKLNLFIPDIVGAVRDWRRHVLDELDNLGIRDNSGIIDYGFYFSDERKRDISTRILSENFKLFPRRLNYDWLSLNEEQIEKAVDEYIVELKRSSRNTKKNEEKKFHKLFNKYSFLLRRDNYSHHWYEPKLFLSQKNFYSPDYVLQPNFNQHTDLSILEIKLPNEGFITKSKFHPKPYKKIMDHIFQVNDYKEYLESEEYQESIRKAFGFIPSKVQYNILVGRLDEKTKGFKIFNKRLSQMNATHIRFITYDELLEYQVQFLERMKLLKVT